MLSISEIKALIDEYANSKFAEGVMKRAWNKKYIPGHAPYNNTDNCYHKWLEIIDKNQPRLSKIALFEELHEEVSKLKIKGIGELSIYDTATLIGCPKGVYPTKVYLHAGTAEGARTLGIEGKVVDKSEFVKVCPDFNVLTPIQIEDFLCIYKSHLQGNPKDINSICCCCIRIEDKE